MNPATILLILNIVFAVFLVMGFLQGLCGLKKSALKLTCFIVGIVLAAIITPVVSKAVMNIKITYNGQLTALKDIILSVI